MQKLPDTIRKVQEFTEYLNETNGESFMKVVRDLIKFDPFGGNKFYIFSFIKLQNRQRYHQPRLTKPEPIPGGTLLRVDPKNPDEMKMCWTLPSQEHFGLYNQKKLFGDRFVYECIQTYKTYPKKLMRAEPDEPTPEDAIRLYADFRKRVANMDAERKKEEENLRILSGDLSKSGAL